MSVSLRENITAVIETCFSETKDEIQEVAINRILELIRNDTADRPRGEWIDKGRNLWECSNCKMEIYSESEQDRSEFHKWCSRCGARMKGADDE